MCAGLTTDPGIAPPNWSNAHPGPDMMTGNLAANIEGIRDRLAQARLPISIFALRIFGLRPERNVPVFREAFGSVGFVGGLPDGSAGFLYVGPHLPTDQADELMARLLGHRALIISRNAPSPVEAYVEQRSIHCSSDVLADVDSLISGLIRNQRRVIVIMLGTVVQPSKISLLNS